MTKLILIFLLAGHSIVSSLVFKEVSILSVIPPFGEIHTYQIFSDLLASVGIALIFIFRELNRQKKSLKPFYVCCLGTIVLGSFAPLLYLLYDKDLRSST